MTAEPTSAVERLERSLELIEVSTETLNAFITVNEEGARTAALASDARRAKGEQLSPLDGTLIAVKDNIDTKGLRTTIGTALYEDRVPEADAHVVSKLRAAGAVVVGKSNMAEFACGTVGFNARFGNIGNPVDLDRYPGGSSAGSAAAVTARIVPLALGTDTSCSVRHPAATCGVVGFKPTWGRVSNEGVSVCAPPADHVGTIASTVADAAALLDVIQHDGHNDPAKLLGASVAGLRVGVLGGSFLSECEVGVRAAHDLSISRLADLGVDLSEVELDVDLADADSKLDEFCADILATYGDDIRAATAGQVEAKMLEWLLSYEDADPDLYKRSLEHRAELQAMLDQTFARFDLLVCPTAKRTAGRYIEAADEPRIDRVGNCVLWAFTGVPSLTVPAGLATAGPKASNMPVGLLINGPAGSDATVLQLGDAFENG